MTSSHASSPPSPRRSRRSAPGRMVVILDSEDRENEGDLVMAAAVRHPGGRSTSWPRTAAG